MNEIYMDANTKLQIYPNRATIRIDFSNCKRELDETMTVYPPTNTVATSDPIFLRGLMHRAEEINEFYRPGDVIVPDDGSADPLGILEARQTEKFVMQHQWEIVEEGTRLLSSERVSATDAKRGTASIVVDERNPHYQTFIKLAPRVAYELLQTITKYNESVEAPPASGLIRDHHEFIVEESSAFTQSLLERKNWNIIDQRAPGERLRNIIRNRMSPYIWGKIPLPSKEEIIDLREKRARVTLRRIIGDRQYYLYRRRGFVPVLAASGKTYLLYPGNRHSQVMLNGKPLHNICVIFREDYPPTDSLLMRMLLILADEENFISRANIHNLIPDLWPEGLLDGAKKKWKEEHEKPLTELFRKLKAKKLVA